MIGPKGKFMLEPDDERTHLLHLDRHGQRAVHLDDAARAAHGAPRRDGVHQRRVVRATTWATASWSRAGRRPASTRSTYVPTVSRPARSARTRAGRGRVGRAEAVLADMLRRARA